MGFEKEAPATSAQADNVVTRDRDRHLPHIPNPKAIKTPSDRRERTQRDPLKVKETIKEISGLDESEPLSPIGPGTFRRTVTGLKGKFFEKRNFSTISVPYGLPAFPICVGRFFFQEYYTKIFIAN